MTGSGRRAALADADVDALATAVMACPAVAGLDEGGAQAVATYLPGRRVVGVRVEDRRVLVSVVLASGFSVPRLDEQVRSTLAPHVGDRRVDVLVADVQTATDHPAPGRP